MTKECIVTIGKIGTCIGTRQILKIASVNINKYTKKIPPTLLSIFQQNVQIPDLHSHANMIKIAHPSDITSTHICIRMPCIHLPASVSVHLPTRMLDCQNSLPPEESVCPRGCPPAEMRYLFCQ